MNNKIKHLEMIERIIERMGNNSFQLKGWAITLVTLMGTLSSVGADKRFYILSFIPVLAFWALDSFYLLTEKKYRELYKIVANKSEQEIDFNMSVKDIPGSLVKYFKCLFSKTEVTFYGTVFVVIVGLSFVLKVW